MSLHHELNHLKRKECPLDTWQIVRISSSSSEEKIAEEVWNLQEALRELMRFTPYSVETGRVERKIYVKKIRKPIWSR